MDGILASVVIILIRFNIVPVVQNKAIWMIKRDIYWKITEMEFNATKCLFVQFLTWNKDWYYPVRYQSGNFESIWLNLTIFHIRAYSGFHFVLQTKIIMGSKTITDRPYTCLVKWIQISYQVMCPKCIISLILQPGKPLPFKRLMKLRHQNAASGERWITTSQKLATSGVLMSGFFEGLSL